MASVLCSGSAAAVASVRRRRSLAAAAAAICALTLGLSNLFPPLSSAFESISANTLSQSIHGIQSKFRSVRSIRMAGAESGATVVPCVVVYVTVPNKELGKKLAEGIVREKLAACVNRVPEVVCEKIDQSLVAYKSELILQGIPTHIETDNEELLIMKTRESLLDALTEHVKANHEYVVPEVIALPITGGSIRYLEWIKNSTRD